MSFLAYDDGALNLSQVVRAGADNSGGITFYLTDGTSVIIGTVASTKAEALTALGLLLKAPNIESYDT